MAKPMSRVRARFFNTAGLVLLSAAIGLPAMAQSAPEEPAALEEVVISGSRVIRDGSNAPTPVTVLGADQLTTSSPRNVQEAIMSLPAFNGSTGITTPVMAAGSNQVGGFLNLRGLGLNRTLTLLDGRRVAPAAGGGGVDFNLLPQALISRVDVVTGGASAAYGSDAVAGVVNVITESNYTGVKGTVQGGISDKGDVGSYKFSLTAGGRYLDDKLHIIASGTVSRNNGAYNGLASRDYWRRGYGRLVVANGTGASATWLDNLNQRNYNGGVILGAASEAPIAALNNLKFLPGGIASPYNTGTFNTTANQVGGDGSRNTISLAALLESESYFARATYQVTDNLEVYIQGMTASAHTRYEPSTTQIVQANQIVIFEGNPFIPANIAALLATATPSGQTKSRAVAGGAITTTTTGATNCGLASLTGQQLDAYNAAQPTPGNPVSAGTPLRCFRMSRIFMEDKRVVGDAQTDNLDLVTGFRAEVFGGYRLSGYYEHGESRFRTYTEGNEIFERMYAALDVIANPAAASPGFTPVPGVAAGTPVCRVRVVTPSAFPGCVPLNPFGFGSPSQAAIDYTLGTSFHRLRTRQDAVAADIAGEPFNLPAGPLAVAVGAEYRKLTVDQISDPLSSEIRDGNDIRGFPASLRNSPGMYNFTNQQPYGGSFSVVEYYGEIDAPLLKELPLVEDLSLNAAYRHTDYSTSGVVETYKVGLSYQPVQSLRFRGTYSRDIRAPSPIELFQGNAQGRGTLLDPLTGANNEVFTVTVGNRDLVPEVATTYSAGAVFTPTWIDGFTASIDWYDIDIVDAIGTLTNVRTLEECTFNNNLCQYVQRDANGVLQRVITPYLNLNARTTSGVDVEFSYRTELGFMPGNVVIRALMGYLDEALLTAPGGVPQQQAGAVSAETASVGPHLKAQGSLTWNNGPLTLYGQVNYVGHGYFNTQWTQGAVNQITGTNTNTVTDNQAPSYATLDLTGRYKFGENQEYEAFLTVSNVFDKAPVLGTCSQNTANFVPANSQLYDMIGRYYTTGLRFKF